MANLTVGSNADALAAAFSVVPSNPDDDEKFSHFEIVKLNIKDSNNQSDDLDGSRKDLDFVGVRAIFVKNHKPEAFDDDFDIAENAIFVGNMRASDPDGDALTWIVTEYPNHGTLTFDASTGGFTYVHDGSEADEDEFEFKVVDAYGRYSSTAEIEFDISNVNDAPLAVNDSYVMNEDSVLDYSSSRNILSNDSDEENNSLTPELVSSTTNGVLVLNVSGSNRGRFKYVPNPNYFGFDYFTYLVKDSEGAVSNVATVTIEVKGKNDKPIARNDSYTTQEDVDLVIPTTTGVLSNDESVDLRTLSAFLVTDSGPTNGSLTLNLDGSFTYEPDTEFSGTDSFRYRGNDGTNSDEATVTITVLEVDDMPVANDGVLELDEGTSKGGTVTASDVDSSVLTFALGTDPLHGSVVVNTDGSYAYTHDGGESTSDSFTFTVSDGTSSDTGIVIITIKPVNDKPVAVADSYSVDEDEQLDVSAPGILANDFDVDGDALTFVLDTDVSNGILVLNSDGSFTYDPSANYNGTDNFSYHVSDGTVDSDVVFVTITVGQKNDAPVAMDDSKNTNEDLPLVFNATDLLVNDSDIDSDALTVVSVENAVNGTVSLVDGVITFNPTPNHNGIGGFDYTVSDGLLTDSAFVNINIIAINDAPSVIDDVYNTNEDTNLIINAANGVLKNDSDPEGDAISAEKITNPANGTIVYFNANGAFRYRPNPNYFGSDSFTYKVTDSNGAVSIATVTINVNPVNDDPKAINDLFSTNEDSVLTFTVEDLLSNDLDADDDTLTITNFTQPGLGTLTLVGNQFSFMPYVNLFTLLYPITFRYTVSDGHGGTDRAYVSIWIYPVNDDPVAVDDAFSIDEDQNLEINVANGLLANDSDVDGPLLMAELAPGGEPTNGTVIIGLFGAFRYTPNANFSGTDTFIYRVRDGVGGSDTGTVSIIVNSINDAPVAVADSYSVDEDEQLEVSAPGILANDFDVDGDALTFVLDSNVSNGMLVLNSDGSFTYMPTDDYYGEDSFTYHVNDGIVDSTAVTVTITVNQVNDAPEALSNLYATDEDTALVVAAPGVLGNDTDVEGTSLVPTLVDSPLFGDLVFNADGSFVYTPDANFNGLDSFTYTVSDGELDSNVATVTINVNPIEDAPVAVDDPDVEVEIEAFETPEDTPLVLTFEQLLGNDYDPDDEVFFQPQMFRVLLMPVYSFDFNTAFSPSVGTLSLDMTGRTVTFTPPLNYVGPAQFEYTIIDEDENVSEPATVFIEVTPVNDAPVASPLAFTIANAGSSTGQLVASDVDDTELVFSLLAAPTNGSATVSPTGAYSYTHNGTATLSDSFTFSVTDGELSATATVTVTVLAAPTPPPVNLPPVANALAFTIANDATSTGTLTGSDPEGAPISFAIATLPANGSLTISPAGIYVYNHNGTATTADSFTFTVSDGSLTSTATVSITILPIPAPGNTPPEVIDGVVPTEFGEPVEGSVAPLGSDADGDDLTFALVDGPTNGTLVFNPDGTYTYTPNDGFNGSDSFTFIANDGTDDSETGTLTINVLEEEEVLVEEPETPLAAPDNNWLWWLLALLAGLLLWLLAFLRPNMKYTLSDKANNQKVVRRRLAKPDDKTMIVELNDKDMVGLTTIEVEFYKRLAKHCGDVTVKFMLKGTQVHSVTIPADIDDVFTTIIHL